MPRSSSARAASPPPAATAEPREGEWLSVTGAREHNLKGVRLAFPKKKLVVFTGVSGSGKSSMAFDTIFAEGQRRYVESLSAYARQFLGQMEKPKYDAIKGLSPTISIEQKSAGHNPRSTVGTVTEIHDYLRVLFARAGIQHCHQCQRPVASQSAQEIVELIAALPERTKLILLAPLVTGRKGEHTDVLARMKASGFVRARINGRMVELTETITLDKKSKHTIEAVVDRLVIKSDLGSRLADSVETALKHGEGTVIAHLPAGEETAEADVIYSEKRACTHCGISFPELSPQSFSFNSPLGMCTTCNGLGSRLEVDADLVVPNPDLSVNNGAIAPYANAFGSEAGWIRAVLEAVARKHKIPLDKPWSKLTDKAKEILLKGDPQKLPVRFESKERDYQLQATYEGAMGQIERRYRETTSDNAREYYQQFMREHPCPECKGARLRPESAAVRVAGRSLVEMSHQPIDDLQRFFESLQLKGAAAVIAAEVLKEVRARLSFLAGVGLGYLTLDRRAPTLSGGESQRIRLASQIGTELTGVLYILDEPSIGLHQRDNRRLLDSLKRLRDIGNTVLVVEHDEETIAEADWVVDFGPGAGRHGGEIVAEGPPTAILSNAASLTGQYMSGAREIPVPRKRRQPAPRALVVQGAEENNLQNVDVEFPLGVFIAVTGVSGAGKSTLVNQILYPATMNRLHGSRIAVGRHKAVKGIEHIDKVIDIDQSPIGRTSRSNPATYVKVYDEIRSFFSQLPEARALGYEPGRFSFNVKGGRCEKCEGEGQVRVEMHFLADVFVPCEVCKGRRFNEATLRVTYKGNTIADILSLTVAEAFDLFSSFPAIKNSLQTLMDVGLDYIQLGQPSPTLSGGEAQRVKLARELSKRATGRTLYILDEPTTGLHFADIQKLLGVLGRLVDTGNTVIVIEHNLDVIKTTDWVVDMGPEGGRGGGRVLATGTPEQVARVAESFTGQYLKTALKPKGRK